MSLARMLEDGKISKTDAIIELSFDCRFFQVGRVENQDLLLALEGPAPLSNINILQINTFNSYKFNWDRLHIIGVNRAQISGPAR